MYGSYQVSEAFQNLLNVSNTSIIQYGLADVRAATVEYVDMYNTNVEEQTGLFTQKVRDRTMGTGAIGGTFTMEYVDEGGVRDTQKATIVPAVLGLPLRRSQLNRQWTRDYFRKSSPADFAHQVMMVTQADAALLQTALRTAIFRATNFTFTDRLVDNQAIPVKAFANADGFPIPPGPDAGTFNASTHSHYIGTANALPTEANLDALFTNVGEHGYNDQELFVNATFGNALITGAGTTYPKFTTLPMPNLQYPNTATVVTGQGTLDFVNVNNRVIGLYNGRKVRVKPWVPALVTFVFGRATGSRLPIGWRIPNDLSGDNGTLRVVFDDYMLPNYIEMMEREFGFGAINRTAIAVLSYGGSDTTYVQPSGL
jgi:hypothetical protein